MAEQIRVGLEGAPQQAIAPAAPKAVKRGKLDELFFNRPVRVHVREFGVVFALICVLIGGWQMYRYDAVGTLLAWSAPAMAFLVLGTFAPVVLHPLWKGWMAFAHVLSVVMTTVVLGLAWVLAFIPMAGLLRVLKIKRIDRTFDRSAQSYWESRNTKYDDFKRLELQF